MPKDYLNQANAILQIFLEKLLLREKKEFTLLANQWNMVSKELDSQILKLADREILSENQLFKLALYQQFQKDAKTQIEQYSKIASGVISNEQKIFGQAGIDMTQEMIELKVSFFQRLPKGFIDNFIGKSFYDGAMLDKTLFAKSYPAYMATVKDKLLTGVALGYNPRKVAKIIASESTAPLWQALRLARTEQLAIMRETSLIQMKQSGVVKGWKRIEQDDELACDYCKSVNGNVYSFDESGEWHPNCRGARIPVINQ